MVVLRHVELTGLFNFRDYWPDVPTTEDSTSAKSVGTKQQKIRRWYMENSRVTQRGTPADRRNCCLSAYIVFSGAAAKPVTLVNYSCKVSWSAETELTPSADVASDATLSYIAQLLPAPHPHGPKHDGCSQ